MGHFPLFTQNSRLLPVMSRCVFVPLQSEPQNSEHEVARASSSPYACDELDSITVMHACFLQILVRRCRHRPPPAACQWGMPPKGRLQLCMYQRKPGAAAGKNASKPKEKSKSGTFYGRYKGDFQKAAGERAAAGYRLHQRNRRDDYPP